MSPETQYKRIMIHFIFDRYEDSNDYEGNLDELTDEERQYLAEVKPNVKVGTDAEIILEYRTNRYAETRQHECDASIGAAIGVLADHGVTTVQIDASKYRRYDPAFDATEKDLEQVGEMQLVGKFSRNVGKQEVKAVMDEVLQQCQFVWKCGEV